MLDLIQVDPRYCWEPMTGVDATALITLSEDREQYALLNEWPSDEDMNAFILRLAFDWQGKRVFCWFHREIGRDESFEAIVSLIDAARRWYLISSICEVTTQEERDNA